MITRFLIANIIFLSALNSCRRNLADEFSGSIKEQIKNTKSNCNITFKNTFEFNWDEVYIFDSMMYPDEISDVLGVPYEGKIVTDGHRLVIFLFDSQIIKDFESSFSGINFVEMRNDGYITFHVDKKFCVEKRMLNNVKQYYLFQND